MALPTYQTSDLTLNLVQSNWASLLNPLLDLPITKGILLEDISLDIGSNTVNHKLGRKLRGWWIVRQKASAAVYDNQDSNPTPAVTLLLISNAAVKVDLFVF